jgi:hypothetical protein
MTTAKAAAARARPALTAKAALMPAVKPRRVNVGFGEVAGPLCGDDCAP